MNENRLLALLTAIFIVAVGLIWWGRKDGLPEVSPIPGPTPSRIARVLVVTQPGCPHCERLKREWPTDAKEAEWVNNTPAIANKYRVKGVPLTLALDSQGGEIKRLLGWYPASDVRRFLSEDDWTPSPPSHWTGAVIALGR